MRACGGSIDPYWKIFAIHDKPEVYDILKEYYIGEIDDRDLDEQGQVDWNVLGDEALEALPDWWEGGCCGADQVDMISES